MKKHGIIGMPPNPYKKGGPSDPSGQYRKDGEQPEETSIPEVKPKSPSGKKPNKKKQ